jgi:nucleoside-diphosphate-sugar epimerase
MKTLVTGASGFIGKHLVKTLVEQGRDVRCLVRKTSDTTYLKELGVELFYGDLRNEDSLKDIAKDCKIVYHLAGEIHSSRCRDFYRVNFEGTKNLVKVCLSNDIDRFIFLSSIGAVGPNQKRGVLLNEQSPCRPISAYGRSKLKAEHFLLQLFKKHEFSVTIIRAPMIYGSLGQSDIITKILHMIQKGRVFIIGSGNNVRSFCHIDNLIQGVISAERSKNSTGEIYFISDKKSYTYNELFQKIAEQFGATLKKTHLPKWLGKICGLVFTALSVMGFCSLPLYTTWNMILDMACDIKKAKEEINFKPQIETKEGLEKTVKYFIEQGLV